MNNQKNGRGLNTDIFRIGTMDTMPDGTSWICGIPGDSTLIYGKIQGLFGRSRYETEDVENQYTYCVFMKDENGEEVFLEVYAGPSGPAIGGLQDERSKEAAQRLVRLIEETEPVDYAYEGFYWDGPGRISQGIKNGVPYYEEESLDEVNRLIIWIWILKAKIGKWIRKKH